MDMLVVLIKINYRDHIKVRMNKAISTLITRKIN